MKKIFLAVVIPLIAAGAAKAAELEDGKFYEDVLISDDLKMEDSSNSAKEKASSLLDQKPKIIKIEGEPLQFRSARTKAAPAAPVGGKPIDTTTKYGEAPFGLSWGATYNQTKALGVDMERVERKDSVNDFIVTKLPKPITDFRQVIVSFGENNSLWRLTAYGRLLNASASKALHLYRKYYGLLERKYGNAKEFFTPKITTVEKKVKDEYGVDKVEIEKISEPIGGADFLAELKSGQAVLYATFEDQDVGAALAVNVDGDGKSYIIIDYTNLRIFREREEQTLDAL